MSVQKYGGGSGNGPRQSGKRVLSLAPVGGPNKGMNAEISGALRTDAAEAGFKRPAKPESDRIDVPQAHGPTTGTFDVPLPHEPGFGESGPSVGSARAELLHDEPAFTAPHDPSESPLLATPAVVVEEPASIATVASSLSIAPVATPASDATRIVIDERSDEPSPAQKRFDQLVSRAIDEVHYWHNRRVLRSLGIATQQGLANLLSFVSRSPEKGLSAQLETLTDLCPQIGSKRFSAQLLAANAVAVLSGNGPRIAKSSCAYLTNAAVLLRSNARWFTSHELEAVLDLVRSALHKPGLTTEAKKQLLATETALSNELRTRPDKSKAGDTFLSSIGTDSPQAGLYGDEHSIVRACRAIVKNARMLVPEQMADLSGTLGSYWHEAQASGSVLRNVNRALRSLGANPLELPSSNPFRAWEGKVIAAVEAALCAAILVAAPTTLFTTVVYASLILTVVNTALLVYIGIKNSKVND